MKYLSVNTVFEGWKTVFLSGESTRAPLNKFFGFLELMRHVDLLSQPAITPNFQYKLVAKELSNSLQDLYYFGNDTRGFNSSETLHVIFPTAWQESVLNLFLKSSTLPIEAAACICMQNIGFEDEIDSAGLVEEFKKIYHISKNEEIFFDTSNADFVNFSDSPLIKSDLFHFISSFLSITDATKFTVGFSKNLYDKKPGELTAGPFIQPLYAGQENLKCILMANFDLKKYYNITANKDSISSIGSNMLRTIPRNKIIYGAPGTGKSYELRSLAASVGFLEDNIIRVTFHPNYSYQQFVGTYKPSPIYKSLLASEGFELYGADKKHKLTDQKEPLIDYSFVPGSFLTQLISALQNPEIPYMLIIEEINRASVSAVFGDVFQLLDRNEAGESEYSIEFNKDISNYLRSEDIDCKNIKMPSNLFIWATMNSADQGVMPLDAAFKRRWSFEYLPIDGKENEVSDRTIIFQHTIYRWNKFRKDVNRKLKEIQVPEDKLIGPFFLSKAELADSNAIQNKLLLYLRDDVVRHNPESLFKHRTFSDIISAYASKEPIFVGLNPSNWLDDDITDESSVTDLASDI